MRRWIPAHRRSQIPIVLLHDSLGSVELWRGFPAALSAQTDRVVLLGHSVGGGMAIQAAAELGVRCEAVITEAAQAFVEMQTVQGIRIAEERFKESVAVARLAAYHGDQAAWVLNAWVDTWLSPECAAWSLGAVLPRVTCPLLVIHGQDDEYGSEAHPHRIRNRADHLGHHAQHSSRSPSRE